jgi:hypothetical protein
VGDYWYKINVSMESMESMESMGHDKFSFYEKLRFIPPINSNPILGCDVVLN